MAAKRLIVGSLSIPAIIALLQSPQRSPGMNPSFLPNPDPKPQRPDPVGYTGSGFPPARSRRFSTGSEPDRPPHWQAEYRRRLGIGDNPIDIGYFDSPKDGEIKINFSAIIAEDHYDDVVDGDDEGHHDPSLCTGEIRAVAVNSYGVVMGAAFGNMKYRRGDKLELQLYALKAAANLAKELKSRGMHDGPVVYVSDFHAMVTAVFHPDCDGEPEEGLRDSMPPDEYLEEVGRSCRMKIFHNASTARQ